MHQQIRLVLVAVIAASALLSSPGFAHQQQWSRVKRGDTVQSIADSIGVSPETIKQWNPRMGEIPYVGQTIYASDPGPNPAWIWAFHLGAVACITYDQQLDELGKNGLVPTHILQRAQVARESTGPIAKIMIKRGHRHAAAIFCDKHGNVVPVGKTVCMWVDPKTKKPIPELEAAQYAPIDDEEAGIRWTFYQYEGCRNAAVDTVHIARHVPEAPPPPVVERISEPEPRPEPAPVPVVSTPEPEPEQNPNIVDHWTFWNKLVRVDPEDGDGTWEDFPGLEGIIFVNRQQTLGVDIYASGGFLGGEDHPFDGDPSINTRLGLQAQVYENLARDQRLRIEGGVFVDAWRKSRDWPVEVGANLTDVGGYGRLIATGPHITSLELLYRQGDKLIFDKRGTFVTEPNRLYFKLGSGIWKYPTLEEDVANETVTFPAERMTITQTRLGFKPHRRVVLYGSWDVWSYVGENTWDQLMKGPGVGIEYRAGGNWTFMGEAMFFKNNWHDADRERRGETENIRGTSRQNRYGFQVQWGF